MGNLYKYLLWFSAGSVLMAAVMTFLPVVYSDVYTAFPELKDVPLLLAGVGVTSTIVGIERRLSQIDRLTESVSNISRRTLDLDNKILLGTSESTILKVINDIDFDSSHKHLQAGSSTIKEFYKTHIPELAKFLKDSEDPSKSSSISDFSVTNRFSTSILSQLSRNSIWCGITLISDPSSWDDARSNSEFLKWVRLCRVKSLEGEIRILRCFWFASESEFEKMLPALEKEIDSGIEVKYLVSGDKPMDISIIKSSNSRINSRDIVDILSADQTVCGMEFSQKYSLAQDSLNIYGPESAELPALESHFKHFWNKASVFTGNKKLT